MKVPKLNFSLITGYLSRIFSTYHPTQALNHYVDIVPWGFEISFIPAEALSECHYLYQNAKLNKD
jgi:hypothetical protein